MASNRQFSFGPVALTTTLTTNILNPAAGSAGVNAPTGNNYMVVRYIRVVNKTTSAVTVSLWLGATGANAAGTEVLWQATSVPANSYIESFAPIRIDSTQFLVGGASANTSLSIEGTGEIGVA